MGRLEGKVAIVTGGALGIGRACAEVFSREGARVCITDVLDHEGESLAAFIRDSGGQAEFRHMDVSVEESVRAAVDGAAASFGRLDVLVNNAGIAGINKPTHELTEEEWDRVQAVNVKGVFFCTKHAIPHMRRSRAGSIINLSSIYGLVGGADVPPYHASKGAVRLMTKTDALIYAADGIRVNSIHPGYIWTPMVEGFLSTQPDPEAAREAVAALHPLGHMGEAVDVAYGALYLACDESKFVTGSELVIDGGYTAR